MTFANPWGLALLGLAVPVLVLHILRPRRADQIVSSLFLWRSVERPVSSAQPWQKLRWSSLLLAQLLAVVLLALAVARPVRLGPARLAAHTVFVIDASASMGAVDGSPDRISSAAAEAEKLRDELPDDGVASIVVAGSRPRVLLTASADREAFSDALRTIDVSEGRADFPGAFALAESLETGTADIGFVLLSDGGLTDEEQRQQPPGTSYRRIGVGETNRAVSRLTVEPRGSSLHVRVTLAHTGGPAATQRMRIDVDGVTAYTQQVELKPGALVDVEADVPVGDRVEAFLEGGDQYPLDDRAVAVAGRRPTIKVLLAGDTAFIGELLAAIPGVELTVAEDAGPTGEGYDVVVYNGTAVPAEPLAPFLAIVSPNGAPGVNVTGVVEQPAIALVRTDDPLLSGIDLSNIGIATAQRVEAPLAETLVGAEGAPLLLRGSTPAGPWAYLAFALPDSNFPVDVAFPLLGDRLLSELSGAAQAATSLEVGAALPLPAGEAVTVVDPVGTERGVEPGSAVPIADRAGFWGIKDAEGELRLVAVNPPGEESNIAPADEIRKATDPRAATNQAPQSQRSVVAWVIIAALVVMLAEWLLARRRRGVGKRQWRIAEGLRVTIALALLAAVFAPVVQRPAQRAATVFLVDGSDSMGAGGTDAALEFVREALRSRRAEDLAGVVVFGAEARLEQLVQASSSLGSPQVIIDRSATNLESAIRLGAALLPEDARRRLVLVSDGRENAGDAAAESEALVDRGIPLDVYVVEPVTGADAAIEHLDVPRLVRQGDAVTVTASVAATEAGPATVVLERDGTEIARQDVQLEAGSTDVTFADVPASDAGGLVRYTARVVSPGDEQPNNDVAFGAVPVEGPARILVVEGTAGEGETLAAALQAGGLVTSTVDAVALPAVEELATYSSIVLVDVDARSLTGEQLQSLETAVRDLGRGLVTVGGERSYGLGGYRGTPLEDLLPVISEITDPMRRTKVAEVLSIDVSGSMANCHCDEGENKVARLGGGVNKTDISKAAAARTVEALSAEDELGVLAWNSGSKWIVDLQQLPAAEVVDQGLRSLKPGGNTNLGDSLTEAADALRASDAKLKHIILFSDGFTDPKIIEAVAEQAGSLYTEDGITVSVIATGEGAAPSLEAIAVAGHGRFYPGRDLQRVPQVIAEEAVIASRNFINEGSFLPEITALTPVTERLTTAPPLLGYVATTAKGSATTELRIGPDRDPLLATWQAGLGRVTSWASDASAAWSKNWASWDGYVGFWSNVVTDTFLAGESAGAAQAELSGGRLTVSVEGASAFPDGSQAVAHVAGPDGQRIEVPLERTSGTTFGAELPVTRTGAYSVGATVTSGGDTLLSASTVASQSYPVEYEPGAADTVAMERWSTVSGGRGVIEAAQAFERTGLEPGVRRFDLRGPLLLLAALLWPIAVAVSRLSLRGASVAGARGGLVRIGRRVRAAVPAMLPEDPDNARRSVPSGGTTPAVGKRPTAGPVPKQAATVNELLERKRAQKSERSAADDADS